jgi:membrane-associated phospholipid phosphatase
MTFITDFADQAVMLPLALAIGIGLWAQGWRRGSAAWGAAVVTTFATVLVLKVVFLACSSSFGVSDVRTPSGHVAAATIVAGGLAALLLRWRHAALLVAVLAAGVIGFSRLALGMHSPREVAIGAGVGLLGAWTLLLLAGRPPPELEGRRIMVIAVAVVVLFHGLHLPAEARIRGTAWRLAHMLSVCQSAEVRL